MTVSNRSAVWSLLLARQGSWVTRDEIESVGGYEAMRRLREVRSAALSQGYSLQQREVKGLLEYTLVPIEEQAKADGWVCAKCGAKPVGQPQPSTDTLDRYRLGWCPVCNKKNAPLRRA